MLFFKGKIVGKKKDSNGGRKRKNVLRREQPFLLEKKLPHLMQKLDRNRWNQILWNQIKCAIKGENVKK